MGGWTENSVKGRESTRFIFQSDILQQSTSMNSCFADKHQYQLFLEEFYGDPVEDDSRVLDLLSSTLWSVQLILVDIQ